MNRLSINLRRLLTREGLSENQLALETGVPQPTINRILHEESKDPRDGTVKKLADRFGVSVEELRRGALENVNVVVPPTVERRQENQRVASVRQNRRAGYVRFPQLHGFAGAGAGSYMPDYPEVVQFVEVAEEWASTNLRAPFSAIRVITARGDSMRGDVDDGDLIFVDSRVKQFDADAMYVFRRAGRVQVKRLQLAQSGLLRIKSSNAAYDPIEVPPDEIEVGGRVLAAWTLRRF